MLTGKSEFHNVRSQYQPQLPTLLKLPELVTKVFQVPVKESIRKVMILLQQLDLYKFVQGRDS